MSEPETIKGAVYQAIMGAANAIGASPEELAAYELGVARAARLHNLTASGIAKRLEENDVPRIAEDRCDPSPALHLVQRWIAAAALARKELRTPPVRVLVLLGVRGVGKTVAAGWALAREGGRYAQFDDLVTSHATRFAPDRGMYLRARAAPLLVVDEVPRGAGDERRAMLHDLIDRRQRGVLTLILGNRSLTEWDALLDERTTDRLGPMAYVRALKGASMRAPLADGRPDQRPADGAPT